MFILVVSLIGVTNLSSGGIGLKPTPGFLPMMPLLVVSQLGSLSSRVAKKAKSINMKKSVKKE